MTVESPWFSTLYVTAFPAALAALALSRYFRPRLVVAFAGYALVVAAFCSGLALRGMRYDVSGSLFALPRVPFAGSPTAKLGAPDGNDAAISIDVLGNADVAHGVASLLVLESAQRAEIDGWAFSTRDRGPCASVVAVVDDKPFAGTYGIERSDVATALGEDHRYTGYRIFVPARAAGRGSHRLSVRCIGAGGRSYEATSTFRLEVRY